MLRAVRPGRALAIYLAAVFLGGAVLSPWVYWLTQWLGSSVPALQTLAANPFHRFVDRTMLVLALTGLWPLVRQLGLKSWSEVGLPAPCGNWGRLAAGFGVGFGSLACVAVLALACGARDWNSALEAHTLAVAVAGFGGTAAVVGVIEELLFRGALFGGLCRSLNWMGALALSSGLYALVHFFQRPPPPAHVEWHSGFAALGHMFGGFAQLELLMPAFFTLTLAGFILGLAYQRTGNLYVSIGLHAGWIFWLKAYKKLTVPGAGPLIGFWGSDNLIDGWLACLMLAAVLAAVWWTVRPGKAPCHDG